MHGFKEHFNFFGILVNLVHHNAFWVVPDHNHFKSWQQAKYKTITVKAKGIWGTMKVTMTDPIIRCWIDTSAIFQNQCSFSNWKQIFQLLLINGYFSWCVLILTYSKMDNNKDKYTNIGCCQSFKWSMQQSCQWIICFKCSKLFNYQPNVVLSFDLWSKGI